MDRPVIVCGLGRVGKRILDYLLAAKLKAVVVNASEQRRTSFRHITNDSESSTAAEMPAAVRTLNTSAVKRVTRPTFIRLP